MDHELADLGSDGEDSAAFLSKSPHADPTTDKTSQDHRKFTGFPETDNDPFEESFELSGDNSHSVSPPTDFETSDPDDSDEEWLSYIDNLPIWAAPLGRIACVLFFVGIAMTISAPSMEVIYYKLACQALIKDGAASEESQCDSVHTQEIVSTYLMWSSVISSIVSLATGAYISTLSDSFGRKPFLAFFVIMSCISSYANYFLITTTDGFPMLFMWLVTAITSCSGGVVALSALFRAYITDVTRPTNRVIGMSCTLVALSLGQIVGPSLSSYALSRANENGSSADTNSDSTNIIPSRELIPLKLALVVLTLASVFSIFFLPESRSRKSMMKSRSMTDALQINRAKVASIKSRIFEVVKTYFRPLRMLTFPPELKTVDNADRFSQIRKCIICLSIGEILMSVFMMSTILIELQYCIFKYKWDSITISNYQVAKSVVNIAGVGALLPFLYKFALPKIKRLTPKADTFDSLDFSLMYACLITMFFAQIGVAFSSSGTSFVVFSIINTLGAISGPVAASVPSKFFPSAKVGEFYGAVSLASGIFNLLTPMVGTALYKSGIRHGFPGMPFVFAALLAFMASKCSLIARWAVRDYQGKVTLV
ncbi:hypothetical protein CA3LBN_004665 [Candidozyma haemuli]|uniref:Major facilitator superfamily (MFS) profile domain-containing protein n=1 Tax=Candidozyma haemuli TaxID=45357 RepID=A0ABX8IAK6_9ASCO|nr:hypothetical protein CA3LBN_004665 [[Candida] haemuloni]